MENINPKVSSEEMMALLKDETKFEKGLEVIKVVFMEAMLSKARKSLEHIKKIVEKYRTIVEEFFGGSLES